MAKSLKHKIGTLLLRRNQKTVNRNNPLSYVNSKTILLLLDEKQLHLKKQLSDFMQKLKADGKTLHQVVYFHSHKNVPLKSNTELTVITKKDFSMWGTPTSANILRQINTPYHILINVAINKNTPLYSIASLSKAFCRVGLNTGYRNHSFYDVILSHPTNNSLEQYLTDISFYLNRLT